MSASIPTDLVQFIVNAVTVLAGLFGTAAAAVKYFTWWIDRRRQIRLESAKALAAREINDGLKAMGQQQLDRIHFACLSGIDRYDGHKALQACYLELGGTDSAWVALRGVGPLLRCRNGFAWVRKLRRKDYVIFAASTVVLAAAAMASMVLVAFSLTFGYTWFTKGMTLERLMSLLLLGSGLAICAMLTYGAGCLAHWYGNAPQLRRRLFKIRAASRGV
jgi:hypothetical protein